ncbi:MAG: hypothetical protein PHX83_06925 [Acidobacteriia bacterium]|nr:hypothetical protein [Terriglobia bacterium]
MTKHYNDHVTIADRALDFVQTVTGAVPVAAPTLVTQGTDCRHLASVLVRFTASQASALNCRVEVIPWLWGQTRTGVGAVAALGWTSLPPILVDCLVGGPLGQVFEVNCEAGDRIYLQMTATNAALVSGNAELFAGLYRVEIQPVKIHGLAAEVAAAMEQGKTPDFVQVAAVTNGIDNTYDYYVSRKVGDLSTGFQFVLANGSGNVTATIAATMQDDGTAPAGCVYQDVTVAITGATPVAAPGGTYFNANLLAVARYIRVRVVANTGGANDGDWNIQYRSA